MGTVKLSTTIETPNESIWAILRDFGGAARWNPAIVSSHSTTEAPNGVGAERRCDLGKGQWTEERITEWNEGRRVEVTIIDSNVPISRAALTLTTTALDENKTRVDLFIDYKLKYGLLGRLMDLLMVRRMYRKTMIELLGGLKHHAETGEEVGVELPAGVTI